MLFVALLQLLASSHVAFLDILAPPYAPDEGRDCTYYFKDTKVYL